MHLLILSWDLVSAPKDVGGFGIRSARDKNIAMLAKRWWKVLNKKNKLWLEIVKNQSLRGGDCSFLKRTFERRNAFHLRIGNGQPISFWLPVGPMHDDVPDLLSNPGIYLP